MTNLLHQLWHAVTGAMTSWYEAKMFIEHASVVSSDALHVLVGTLIWIAAAIILRKNLSTLIPWTLVLGLTLFNEVVDLWIERWPDLAMQYGESAKDVLLTMALPTVLLMLVRTQPGLFGAFRRARR